MKEETRGAVIVGASSGVGRALAEELARRGWRLVLAAQDARDLSAVAAELSARFHARAAVAPLDLSRPELDVEAFRADCDKSLGHADALFAVAGYVDDEDQGLAGDAALSRLVEINYLNSARLLGAFARAFDERGTGRLVGFSSIAAAAPRRRNLVYASAKAGLENYLRALRHYFVDSGVLVQGYALGYVDTAMVFGRRVLLPPVAASEVARRVAADVDRDIGIVFYPGYWRWIMAALRALPWFVYKRLDF